MESGQKTLSSLFDGRKIFNIPQYQRAYAWEERQLNDFVEDVRNQEIDRDYFFGTILFQQKGAEGPFEVIDVVDGQQRITTVVIFMKLLLDLLEEQGDDVAILRETYIQYREEYKLRILPSDNDFFRSYILQDNRTPEAVICTPSQRRLLNAKRYLVEQLKGEPVETLQEFRDKIERTKVLIYSVVNTAEATLIFETTNDRGKSLTNLEKIKSFLMYKTYLAYDEPDSHLDDIQYRFSKIYHDYDDVEGGESRIAEDTILQYHFIAFEDWSTAKVKKPYQHHVQQVKQTVNHLIKEDKAKTREYIENYSRELRETFAIIKKFALSPDKYLLDIFALGRTRNFYPLLIKTYKFDRSKNKQDFHRVAKLIGIISFRVFGIRRRRTNTGIARLFRLARDFKGDYENLLDELRDFGNNYCDTADFRNRLLSPTFHDDVALGDQNYLFWKYENFLRRTEQPVAPEMPYQEFLARGRVKLSIEHIAPQNPRKSKVIADESVLPPMTMSFKEKYLHSIGNLTIDPLSANISKSNRDFASKNQLYFSKAPLKVQNELADFLNPHTKKWDTRSIEMRSKKIVEFALSCWEYQSV
jgi:hypothetical protein